MNTSLTPAQREDLKQKAEAGLKWIESPYASGIEAIESFQRAAHPAAILSLLAERDDLTQQLAEQEVEKLELVKELAQAREQKPAGLYPNGICRVTGGKYKHCPVRLMTEVSTGKWHCTPNGQDGPVLVVEARHLQFIRHDG